MLSSDAIDVGDEIQEINGITVHGRDPMEVIRMLVSSLFISIINYLLFSQN